MENLISKVCKKCRHNWSLQPVKPIWKGDKRELKKWERERKRKWNHCYCGYDLYEEEESGLEIRGFG